MADPNRGIYRKFIVRRTDRTDRRGGKHEDCNYFVLDLDHDPFARPALRAYAKACRRQLPLLARDVDAIVAAPSMRAAMHGKLIEAAIDERMFGQPKQNPRRGKGVKR